MLKIKKTLSLLLSMAMLLSVIHIPTVNAEAVWEENKWETVESYSEAELKPDDKGGKTVAFNGGIPYTSGKYAVYVTTTQYADDTGTTGVNESTLQINLNSNTNMINLKDEATTTKEICRIYREGKYTSFRERNSAKSNIMKAGQYSANFANQKLTVKFVVDLDNSTLTVAHKGTFRKGNPLNVTADEEDGFFIRKDTQGRIWKDYPYEIPSIDNMILETKDTDYAYPYFKSVRIMKAITDPAYIDSANLTLESILNGQEADNVVNDLNMPSTMPKGSSVSWICSPENIIAENGTVTRPESDTEVEIKAIVKGTGSTGYEKTFKVTVRSVYAEQQDESDVQYDKSVLTAGDIQPGTYILPTVGVRGSKITWTSDNAAITMGRTDWTCV